MPADILALFAEFGLNKEAGEVYLHLLQAGRQTVSEVAESLHLTSRAANDVLRELSKKGLAKRISTNPETFLAAYPAPLIRPAIDKEAMKLQHLSELRDQLLELWDVERTKAQGLPVEWCPIEEGFTVLYRDIQSDREKALDYLYRVLAPSMGKSITRLFCGQRGQMQNRGSQDPASDYTEQHRRSEAALCVL
jgi:DNA-binding Lrp family transcriptional regulator